MAVTVTNLIAGPATLYTAAFGAAEPADSNVSASPSAGVWIDAGATQDGITLTVDREFLEMDVDQLVDMPGRRLTKRDFQVATNLAEPTLANLLLNMNGGTSAASAAFATYDPDDSVTASQQTYRAILIDGFAPQTAAGLTMRRRVIVRKVLSIESIESAYKKDEMTLYPVTFSAHWVSASIRPFHIVDQLT